MEEQNTELKLFGKPCVGPTAQLSLPAAFLQPAIIHAPDLLFLNGFPEIKMCILKEKKN